jgi:predicted  nucleic acid-binding Zn-ribbon protein
METAMKSDPEPNNLPDPSSSVRPENGQESDLQAECARLRRRVAELEAERERDRARLAQVERELDFFRQEEEEELREAIEEGRGYTIDDILADLEGNAKESQA